MYHGGDHQLECGLISDPTWFLTNLSKLMPPSMLCHNFNISLLHHLLTHTSISVIWYYVNFCSADEGTRTETSCMCVDSLLWNVNNNSPTSRHIAMSLYKKYIDRVYSYGYIHVSVWLIHRLHQITLLVVWSPSIGWWLLARKMHVHACICMLYHLPLHPLVHVHVHMMKTAWVDALMQSTISEW